MVQKNLKTLQLLIFLASFTFTKFYSIDKCRKNRISMLILIYISKLQTFFITGQLFFFFHLKSLKFCSKKLRFSAPQPMLLSIALMPLIML